MDDTQQLPSVVGANNYGNIMDEHAGSGQEDGPEVEAESRAVSVSKSTASLPSNFIPAAGTTTRSLPAQHQQSEEAYVDQDKEKLRARVFELENRLRETEEELEFYFTFYKKAKRAGSVAGANTAAGDINPTKNKNSGESKPAMVSEGDSDSDSELDDGAAPGNAYYAEPWSKTLGRNAALEYTRDSPMFRKRLWAFQETLKPLQGHSLRLVERTEAYCAAGEAFRQRGVALAEELSSKEASRLMFSNNFRGMGDLAANMAMFSSVFKQVHELLGLLIDSLRAGLTGPMSDFKEAFRDLDALSDELDRRGAEYESRLSKALDQKNLPTEGPLHDRTARARWDFELYRFDLVRYVNQLDAKKVLLLESGINNAFYALLAFFQGGSATCDIQEKAMRRRQVLLNRMNKRYEYDNALWSYVRSRLEAELQGALPPPGAPPGARAPINPRASCPVYVAELTTEVLSADSQEASPTDLAHVRDEGVLKQGYLFKRQVFGRKERCWYRLHSSRLYNLELGRAATGDVPVMVFDLRNGATVARRPGKNPFCFLLVSDDGYRLELQAENEDDMHKWMAAIRRCQRLESAGPPQRRGREGGEASVGGGRGGDRSMGRVTNGVRAEVLMEKLEKDNPGCAECGSTKIEWVSLNIGVTLCSPCATIHRTLGNNVSNLRSLTLDQWSVFVLQTLVEDLGNNRAAEIWECNISPGWTKPRSDACPQEREQWIIAKYRWYGFVGEDSRDLDAVSKSMLYAAARGDVNRIVWCLAHKGDVNWIDAMSGGRTALHMACEADKRRAAAVLLLNGACMSVKDESGISAQDMVVKDPYSDLARLLAEKERGDLW